MEELEAAELEFATPAAGTRRHRGRSRRRADESPSSAIDDSVTDDSVIAVAEPAASMAPVVGNRCPAGDRRARAARARAVAAARRPARRGTVARRTSRHRRRLRVGARRRAREPRQRGRRRRSLDAAFGRRHHVLAAAREIPTPESHFGFRMGADRQLADADAIEKYFELVAGASDRVKIVDIGPTTEGHRTIAAIVSAPENIRNLDRSARRTSASPIRARSSRTRRAASPPRTRPCSPSAAASTRRRSARRRRPTSCSIRSRRRPIRRRSTSCRTSSSS